MRHFFLYDGKRSEDFGVNIATVNHMDGARRSVTPIEIPGRNGTLTIDNGRYENVQMKYDLYVSDDLIWNMQEARAWLLNKGGYRRLEDTFNPGEYYMARCIDGLTVDRSDRVGAKYTLTFDRMPQRFLKTGEISRDCTGGETLYNRTRFGARPMLRIYGSGSLYIGSDIVTVNTKQSYIDLDCDTMDAYHDAINCNADVELTLQGDYLELGPGETKVTMSGITKVTITPRWWTL